MARNRTAGAIQVADNSVASINIALQQVLNRLDTAFGLRGPASVNDRLAVSEPSDNADAVNKGSLAARITLFHTTILALGPCGVAAIAPGTTYSEVGRSLRSRVNFDAPESIEARLIVYAWGSEAALGKGVALYTLGGTQVCDVTWDGQDEGVKVGEYTPIVGLEDQGVAVYAKGASATENIIVRYIAVEFRLTAGSALEST
jgi:hypothetical protein